MTGILNMASYLYQIIILQLAIRNEFNHVVMSTSKKWIESDISTTAGHYPGSFCRITNVVLSTTDQKLYYKNDNSEFQSKVDTDCVWNKIMWSLSKSHNETIQCDKIYDTSYLFPFYWYRGGSNYHHLHYDIMIPYYHYLYYKNKSRKNSALFPGVETARLQVIDWRTPAFNDETKFWNRVMKVFHGDVDYVPVNESLVNSNINICIKSAHFGIPKVEHADEKIMKSFVLWVKRKLSISHDRLSTDNHRVGLIKRNNRRRIVNEVELIDRIKEFVDAELVVFEGFTFKQQVETVQKYTVLLGMNGAGLMNAIYLPPGAVAVQLVPYKAVLDVEKQSELYSARGPYLEWHNARADLVENVTNGDYSQGDTLILVEEFVTIVKEALSLVNSDLIKTEL